MMEILTIGDKSLNKVSKRVAHIDDTLRMFCANLAKIMYENEGIGIAAPQVGVLKRVIVIDHSGTPIIMINPEITSFSVNQCMMEEGCLSVPNQMVSIERSDSIEVRYRDTKGKPHFKVYDGLIARVIQHEVDHLNGILMVEYDGKDIHTNI